MGIYIFLYLYIVFFAILQIFNIKNKKMYQISFGIIWAILIFIAGCRYGLETDYWHYYNIFYWPDRESIEPGIKILISIVRFIKGNYNAFLIIVALLSLSIKLSVFKKYNMCFITLAAYFLRFYILYELNGIRQGLSIAFIIVALYYLDNDDIKKFVFFVIIGTIFHVTALAALILLPLKNVQFSLKKVIIILAVSILLRYYLLENLIAYLRAYVPMILNSDSRVINGMAYIANSNELGEMTPLSITRIVLPMILLSICKANNKSNLFFNSMLFGSVINILFIGLDTISFRLASVLYSCEGMLLAKTFDGTNMCSIHKFKPLYFTAFTCILFFDTYSYFNTIFSSSTLIPYRTFFWQ